MQFPAEGYYSKVNLKKIYGKTIRDKEKHCFIEEGSSKKRETLSSVPKKLYSVEIPNHSLRLDKKKDDLRIETVGETLANL